MNSDIIKKQKRTYTILNFFAFTIIFAIFGIIIFTIVQNTLYTKADQELEDFRHLMMDDEQPGGGRSDGPPDKMRHEQGRLPNPRILILNWNDKGEILNAEQIGTLFYENYSQDLSLNKEELDSVQNLMIDGQYHFRAITFPSEKQDVAYTQLLINVDPEYNVIHNFGRILIICSILFIALSLAASYWLSNKTMQPIIKSWRRQAEFAENASHELRTPLTIIQNKLELLLTEPTAKIMDKFDQIALGLSETRRLSRLTADMLTLARADSAEKQLRLERLEFDKLVQSASAPYTEIAELQGKKLWFSLGSGAVLDADKNRLHQLIVILLDNALKYTGENGSIGIKTYKEENRAVLEVSDTGIGISDENRERIFERFYREDKARTRETGGTGLGLSIAQWIAESHKGSIKADKNSPKGTIFTIKLPSV
jgi:two-component system, OmpR family, sensor histidine kinase CiaH